MADNTLTKEQVMAFLDERTPHTVLGALGVTVEKADASESAVKVDVSERLFQHAGIVHGGIYILLMESAASLAAALSVDVTQFRVAGQEMSAAHVRASTSGTLIAKAWPVHSGRTSIVYLCDVHNDGKLVSTGRCTIAVRPMA